MGSVKFLLRTSSSDEHYNGDIDFCLVEVTKQLARRILHRRKVFTSAKKSEPELWEMYFWGGSGDWVPYSGVFHEKTINITKEQEALLDDNNFVELPDEYSVDPDSLVRTECEQMIVREDEVCWTVIPKHSSIYIMTHPLPYKLIEKLK